MLWMEHGYVSAKTNIFLKIIILFLYVVNCYYILTKYLQKLQDIVKLLYMILNWGNWIYATVKHGSSGT